MVLTQCTTNALPLASGYVFRGNHHLRCTVADFVSGLTHPYRERVADVIAFFNKEARPGQSVFGVDNEFPLQFYTRLKIIDASLNGDVLTDPLADWVMSESAAGLVNFIPMQLPPVLAPYYEAVLLPVHPSPRSGSIPDPDLYQYRSPDGVGQMVIYRLKR